MMQKPSWAEDDAGIWAPDLVYSRTFDRYYLTFVVTDTNESVSGVADCGGDSAIGVATSRSPVGPWRISDTPLVGPRHNPDTAQDTCDFWWTFDPDVLGDSIRERSTLYYGSYVGGVFAKRVVLTRNGMRTRGEATRITIANRYEGSNVVRRGGWYYFFGSATDCCRGPLTGYSVFAGRSRSPLGPFLDRDGNSLLAGRVGGTPVLSMNGNRWVGTGHNSTFRDFDGQWWTAYHAVNRFDPYFVGGDEEGFTKRPALLDPVTWRNGWPSVRAGRWASDRRMPAPAAKPREDSRYRPNPVARQMRGALLPRFTARFDGATLGDRWSWKRQPADGTYGVEDGRLRFKVQQADLYEDTDTASVLLRNAPRRDFVVQTKVGLNLPPEGCCHNYAQAGLVLYGSDDRYIKLVHASIWDTRQTEFAKEVRNRPAPVDPSYGNTVVGTPGRVTMLRIVKETRGAKTTFTGYTRRAGQGWVRGGTWVHNGLRDDLKIGLVSMGLDHEADFTAKFHYVKTWALR
jgi:arabinan endo-1,5-alpha-L-arabinosidase